jgi:hypothetical protein
VPTPSRRIALAAKPEQPTRTLNHTSNYVMNPVARMNHQVTAQPLVQKTTRKIPPPPPD